VSVAICTWNRSRLLGRTLSHFSRLRVPRGLAWELLVVENCCTDETPAVVRSFADRLPIVELVEPAIGLANARNCARLAARGDLLVFTDDDVLVDEEWLATYVAAAGRWPNATHFGGTITPLYESELPPWYRANGQMLRTFVGEEHDLGPTERVLSPGEAPWGGNMAFRRAVFENLGFDTALGRRGFDRTDREDEVFCETLAKLGFQGVWVPSAKIQHVVTAEHLTLSLVRRNCVGHAVTRVRLSEGRDGAITLFGVPRWLIRTAAQSQLKYRWQRLTGDPGWFGAFVEAWHHWGTLSEHWRRRRTARG